MTDSPSDVGRDEQRVLALLRDASRVAVDETAERAGRHQLLMAVRSRSRARAFASSAWASRRFALVAAFAAVGCVAAVALWQWPRPLSYEVTGTAGSGAYLSAPADGQVEVRFSDGSRVRGLAGSRLRIVERTARGARVSLERGQSRYDIVHAAGTQWSVAAGPFDVRVTGTRFELGWDPASEVLLLQVRQGSVEVAGPLGATPIAVREGQGLQADLVSERLTVFSLEQQLAEAEPSVVEPVRAPASQDTVLPADRSEPPRAKTGGTADSTRGTPSVGNLAAAQTWASLVANGQFDAVLRAAREQGIDRCLSVCSASDLSALGDAARYSGQTRLALSAIERSYQRFGSSNSAFLMGRTLESSGELAGADKWYRTYLARFPSGGLAAEALAGRMRAVHGTQGREAAVPLARDYLLRYPSGVHTKTARRILEQR